MKAWLADLPSTNARIALSLLLAIATGIRVIAFGWDAPLNWLGFLSLWAGLDVAQYVGKRATYKESPPGTQDVEDNAAEPKADDVEAVG